MQLRRSGTATQPCLTLLVTGNQSDSLPFAWIQLSAPLYNLSKRLINLSDTPIVVRMHHSTLCSTESNAALRSIMGITDGSPFGILCTSQSPAKEPKYDLWSSNLA